MKLRALVGTLALALLVLSSAHAADLLQMPMLDSEAGAAPPLQADAHVIKLRTGDIAVGTESAAEALAEAGNALQAAAQALGQPLTYMYYLVHVPRRAGYWDADAIDAAGFGAVQMIPENTIVVRCPVNQVNRLAAVSGADLIVPVAPQYKVAPELRVPNAQPTPFGGRGVQVQEEVASVVNLFAGEPPGPVLARLQQLGVSISYVTPDRGDGASLHCHIEGLAFPAVLAHPGVQWVEPEPDLHTTNDILTGETAISGDSSRGLLNAYDATHHATKPVTGAGQVVGHIDSGVDRGGDGGTFHSDLDGTGQVDGEGLANRTYGIYHDQRGSTHLPGFSSTWQDAQDFTATWTGQVHNVTMRLGHSAVTSLGGTCLVRLRTSSGGTPGSILSNGASDTVAGSSIPYSAGYVTFSFGTTRPSVTRGTDYFLELDYTGLTGVSASNYFRYGWDQNASTKTGYYYLGGWQSWSVYPWYDLIGDNDTGHWLDLNGHGTHTAGTICASGDGISKYRGVAYAAALEHRCAGTGSSSGISIPDFYAALDDCHDDGARVHSNSWGGGTAGAYQTTAREADRFMWDNPTSLVVCSAGNEGVDSAAPNGKIDPTSVSPPGTAKNILSVGASETYRTTSTQIYSSSDWPNAPINGSYRTRQSDTNGGSTTVYGEGLMAFSSRGPTNDTAGSSGERRIKPDVVAPGWLYSCISAYDDNPYGWPTDGTHPSGYRVMNGTSMACPAVAGAAALVRDYLVDYTGLTEPTAALIKAILIAGCDNLSPGQYQTGSYRELYDNANGTGSPDFAQGYGRVDVAQSLGMLDSLDRGFFQSAQGFTNTTTAKYVTLRAASSTPLSAVLVWTDYPATAGATNTLINDLDLEVRTSYTGAKDSGTLVARALLPYNEQNGSGGGTGDDDRNTVEKCAIASPTAGTYYTFEVDAETLGQSGQNFSLLITGDYDTPTPVTILDFTGSDSRVGPRLRWRLAEGLDIVGCHIYRSLSPNGPFERVSGRMITPEAGEYHFTDFDLDLARGKAYYRIEAIRSDGLAEEQDSPPFAVSAD